MGVSEHHGQWQAQGDDIPERGHSRVWACDDVPTNRQGMDWLAELMAKCERRQATRRARAHKDAMRFLERAPSEGYPSLQRSFYARDDDYKNARIDVEIYGCAFRSV